MEGAIGNTLIGGTIDVAPGMLAGTVRFFRNIVAGTNPNSKSFSLGTLGGNLFGLNAQTSTPSPADILTPGGQQVGRAGASGGIRRLNGGLTAAQTMFDQLSAGGKDITPVGNPGKLIQLTNGGRVGLRPISSSTDGSPSLDINIPGIPVKKIHFEP